MAVHRPTDWTYGGRPPPKIFNSQPKRDQPLVSTVDPALEALVGDAAPRIKELRIDAIGNGIKIDLVADGSKTHIVVRYLSAPTFRMMILKAVREGASVIDVSPSEMLEHAGFYEAWQAKALKTLRQDG